MDCRTDINYEDARGKKNRAVSIYYLLSPETRAAPGRAAVSATVNTYRDLNVEGADLYIYTVTPVGSQGHESPIE